MFSDCGSFCHYFLFSWLSNTCWVVLCVGTAFRGQCTKPAGVFPCGLWSLVGRAVSKSMGMTDTAVGAGFQALCCFEEVSTLATISLCPQILWAGIQTAEPREDGLVTAPSVPGLSSWEAPG